MRFLLDTHSLLWFFGGHPQLSDPVRKIIEDTTHQKLISMASVWEIAIKLSKNKLTLAVPLDDYIEGKIQLVDFELLTIQLNHLKTISTLPFHHNDPFDRLIIAQGITDNLPILSKDLSFDAYAVERIWDRDPTT